MIIIITLITVQYNKMYTPVRQQTVRIVKKNKVKTGWPINDQNYILFLFPATNCWAGIDL